MTIAYTPTGVFTQLGTTAAIPMPDAPVGVTEPVMNLADAARASRACLYSYLDWDQRVWTTGTLANTGNIGVWVGGINAIALQDPVASPALIRTYNLRVPTQVNVGGTVLTGSIPYYLYAYIDSGSLVVEASLTAPEQNYFHWKNGAPFTHRYLGAFVTDSTGVPLPFYSLRGEFRYAFPEIADTGADSLQPWGLITGPGATTVDLTGRVPAVTLPVRALLRVFAQNADGAAAQEVTVAPAAAFFGGTIVNPFRWDLLPDQILQDEITMELSQANTINVTPATVDVTARVYCRGWIDPGFP